MVSQVTQWQCEVETEGVLTVGAPFVLSCQGEALSLNRETLSLRRPKDNPYALRILKVESLQAQRLEILATTYVTGENGKAEIKNYGVTDGTNTIELAPLTLDVRSVISEETNAEPTPYPAYAPIELGYPSWIWLMLAFIVAVICAIIARVWYRGRQRKQFLKEISEKSTALAPYHQLQKDLRQITRILPVADLSQWSAEESKNAVSNLISSYHWFLAREFKVPAHKWSASLVSREIKKIDRKLFKHAEKSLELAQRELRRALLRTKHLSLQDFQQLLEIVRKSADVIHLHRQEERRR